VDVPDLTAPPVVRRALQSRGLRPNRALGQHFLVDPGVAAVAVEALEPRPDDVVVEIGAGLGGLTASLAASGANVVAIELDRGLAAALRELLPLPNVEVVCADALHVDLAEIRATRGRGRRLKVAGNLPYGITSPIFGALCERRGEWYRLVAMVQKEVADRLLAPPGTPAYGSITVVVRHAMDLRRLRDVGPSSFLPRPAVSSSLLLGVPRDRAKVDCPEDVFAAVVRGAFRFRRKTLENALFLAEELPITKDDARAVLEACGIDPGRRAETLSLGEFQRLACVVDGFARAGRGGSD